MPAHAYLAHAVLARAPRALAATLVLALATGGAARCALAQGHEHRPGMTHPRADTTVARAPTQPGQATYAAIGEIVRLLDADPGTDWARVDVERLRRHLLDMDAVTMRAMVRAEPLADGARFTVRGTGATVGAIQRLARAHAATMAGEDATTRMEVATIADGATVTVRTHTPGDARGAARIRALGFVGLLTAGEHHGPHHLAMARGDAMGHHGH
jgi:hypothetical protein